MRILIVIVLCLDLVDEFRCIDEKRITGELRRGCANQKELSHPPARVNTTCELANLRNIMSLSVALDGISEIDALLVTTHDEHQGEFVADHEKRLQYISGFSGSSGEAIITLNKAALWTDGRYYLQADEQLDCNWLLLRVGYSFIPSKAEWLRNEFPNGARVGADPKLIANSTWSNLETNLENSGIKLVELNNNPIDKVWKNRPPRINSDAFVWDIQYAGKNWTTKVSDTRTEILKLGADAMIVTALDEIAWILNIRGRDIPHNFFIRSYLILTNDTITLYVNQNQLLRNNIRKHLNSDYGTNSYSVMINDYFSVWDDLPTESQKWTFLIPSEGTFTLGASRFVYSKVPTNKQVAAPSPVIYLKSLKNEAEIKGMENAHIRDAVVMCKFFAYLEKRFAEKSWSETEIATILDEHRFEQKLSLGNSFRTIAAFGSNGALPNYEPTKNTNLRIYGNNTLVLDSGGQYQDGTTVITRTLHLGEPTDEQKAAYTRVLMGSVQFSNFIFPGNMKIAVGDVMVRAPLWEVGLDYSHDSGHGVGSFSSVHESPITIHYNQEFDEFFRPGYFFSNEAAYYKEGEFGIRLENVLEVVEKSWLRHSSGNNFYGFKVVTLVPYEPKLIDSRLLTFYQRKWLNRYNSQIRDLVGAELKRQNQMEGYYWMLEKTASISEYENKSFKKYPHFSCILIGYFFITILYVV